jgi:hypothetical protein
MPERTRSQFLVLAGNLVREEDRSFKKPKREVRHAKQGSDRPGVAAAQAASLEQASPTIDWIVSLARNLRCHPDADLEGGIWALLDAAQLRSLSLLRIIEFLSSA